MLISFIIYLNSFKFNEYDPILLTEILIIRPQSIQLGDTICSLPMFKALKNKFPDSYITFIGCPTNYNVNLKKLNPYINEFTIFRKDNIKVVYYFFKNLRKKKYDLIIVPTTIRISSTSYMIAMLAKGKKKIGFTRIDEKRNRLGFVLDIKLETDWVRDKTNQVFRFLDSVKCLGCDISIDEIKKMRMDISKDDIAFGNAYAEVNFPDKSRLVFGFHPGGGNPAYIWDFNNYFELIKKSYERYNPYILITSGFLDKDITDKLESKLKEANIPYIYNKDMDAYGLAAVLKHVNVYATNNTGVMHLAAFTGTNTVSVFRKGDTAEWQPLYNNSKCVESKTDSINSVTVEEVFEKITGFKF